MTLFKTVKGKRVQKTPEEVAQEEREGQQFIQERERLAGQRMKEGASELQSRQKAQLDISKQATADFEATPGEQARIKLERQAAEANVMQAALQQELAKLNAEEQTTQIPEVQTEEKKIMPLEKSAVFGVSREERGDLAPPLPQGITGITKQGEAPLQSGQASVTLGQFAGIAPETLKKTENVLFETAAELYDTLHTAISRKEPLKRVKAKENFKAAVDVLERSIKQVEAGQKTVTQARREFIEADAAINRLERSSKLLGRINLDWFVDSGIGVQADIANEKSLIQQLRLELEIAEQKRKLNIAKTNLGL